jgi:hypothetical protein
MAQYCGTMAENSGDTAVLRLYSTIEANHESHNSLRISNSKSLPSAVDNDSLSPGGNFQSDTLTTSQPSQLDTQDDVSASPYCEECFYCPECSDHSDCESCVECETCIECDDCEIMMERTRRCSTGMTGEADGMTHCHRTTSSNSALLQHSGDDGWMDFVNIPQDADVTGDQNSAANNTILGALEQDASTTVQSDLLFMDGNSPSNFSTGFLTTEGYTEEASNATTGCYLVAEPLIELRILNLSDLFGVGQQFDGIPLNYGDKAAISASPTLVVDDDALFRYTSQAAEIVNAAAVGDARIPVIQPPLPAYIPAQARPATYPVENSLRPTVDTSRGPVTQDAIGGNAHSGQQQPPMPTHIGYPSTSDGNWQAPSLVRPAHPYNPDVVPDPYAQNPHAGNLANGSLATSTAPPPPGFAFHDAPSTRASGPSDAMASAHPLRLVRNTYAHAIMVANPTNANHDLLVTTRPATRPARARKICGNSLPAKKTCAYCPDKGPFDASGLAKHKNSLEHQKALGAANPTRKYACPYCEKRFPRQDHIKRHVLKAFRRANDNANNTIVVPPKCPVLRKKDAEGQQGVWEWELEANGSYALIKDRGKRNPFMMPIGYKANMKRIYGGRHGQ